MNRCSKCGHIYPRRATLGMRVAHMGSCQLVKEISYRSCMITAVGDRYSITRASIFHLNGSEYLGMATSAKEAMEKVDRILIEEAARVRI